MGINEIKARGSYTPGLGVSRKSRIQVAILVAVLSPFLWYEHQHLHPVTPVVEAVQVKPRTIQIQRGDIEQAVTANGKLQLLKYADINAQVSGQVSEVLTSIGEEVKAGKLLLKISPTLSTAQFEGNQAELARLRAELTDQQVQLDFAQLQFKRQTQLKAESATREEAFEASRAAMSSASARVEAINARIRQTEATIKEAEEERKHTDVTTPITGTVVALAARIGQSINAHQQMSALVRVADLSKLTVEARVAEIDVPHLHTGINAFFTTPGYPDRKWSGKVRQIIPVAAEGSGEMGKDTFYNVLFDVGNTDRRLLSGMSTRVTFVLAQVHDVATIPVGVLGKPDVDGLYVLQVRGVDNQPHARKVKIGLRDQFRAQVLSGIDPSDQVIIDPPIGNTLGSALAVVSRPARNEFSSLGSN